MAAEEREARPEIQPDEIELLKLIGEGTFGKVYQGKCRGKEVAVKVFKNKDLSEEELSNFRDEVAIMSKIVHPNIVLFLGACTSGEDYRIVTDLMPKDLETLFLKEKAKGLSVFDRVKMLKHAALGMNWLHCSNPVFIHRDLKLSNLLVDDDYKVYVCDFGLTQMKPKDAESLQYDPHGSPLYMAPEVFVGEYDEKCDVYSFGIIIWETLTLEQAYQGISENLPAFMHQLIDLHVRPEIPSNCGSSLKDLMVECWSPLPKDRPSFATICDKMDRILIDEAIRSKTGRKLWRKKRFIGNEEVAWKVFEKELKIMLKRDSPVDDIKFKCLKEVLAADPKKKLGKNKEVVNMVKYGNILDWFGPFERDDQGLDFLDRLEDMLKKKWFHGDISTPKATDRLSGQEPGTFLIRFSSSAPGCYTISSVDNNGRVLHQRVTYTPKKGFEFWSKTYDTLKTLIRKEKKHHHFLRPCPGSPFRHLFEEDDSQYSQSCYVAPDYNPPPKAEEKEKKKKKDGKKKDR
eukprot:CAMPEP_0201508716 /NCGR_PEP_ID=MMETSP0161_2-20130828/1986_1 /ASSEMBLY_ACC=CAM_ASM_000251 /TAXON_ID=180227 /ORGANISM="Neoparamoeba aestuarina, Strain SoJaBio B1-5/56/2" /LENGTH=515 /DNA_ID=CAMNT_0047903459 /DNA_START=93 /DNA_END=1640 /DNA_ORIENTATION=-